MTISLALASGLWGRFVVDVAYARATVGYSSAARRRLPPAVRRVRSTS